MSASFYELQKYAKTGLASLGMTAYDKMRALSMAGGAIKTLTGVPPLSFIGNGKPLISLSMLGNGQHTGTPTPDNIIMPTFCGVRTGNLADTEKGGLSASDGSEVEYNATQSQIRSQYIPCDALAEYTVSSTNYPCNSFVAFYAADKSYISRTSGTPISQPRIISTPENAAFMRVAMYHASDGQIYPFDDGAKIMLNSGSTALPYEPYGYKIPITCAGQTTPIYLGQTQTVRRVKKIDLGTKTWSKTASGNFLASLGDGVIVGNNQAGFAYCSHFAVVSANSYGTTPYSLCVSINSASSVAINKTGYEALSTAEFQNAMNGVYLWYVLAEPETGIVNEPLAKIGDYADELNSTDAGVSIPIAKGENTLTVDTDLQPSSMTIEYKS